jgi:hypothetical protein
MQIRPLFGFWLPNRIDKIENEFYAKLRSLLNLIFEPVVYCPMLKEIACAVRHGFSERIRPVWWPVDLMEIKDRRSGVRERRK